MGNESDCKWMFLKRDKMVAWKKPGKVSRSCMQHMDGNTFISQQQALKSQQRVKPAFKLSAVEKVWRAVYCTFKRSFSHGPALKPNPNQTNLFTSLKDFLTNFRCLSVFTGGGPTTSLPPEDFGNFPDVLNLRITVYHLKSNGGHPTKQNTSNFIIFLNILVGNRIGKSRKCGCY